VDLIGFAAINKIGASLDDFAMTNPLVTMPAYFVVSPKIANAAKLMKTFEDGYAKAQKSGAVTRILKPYFGGNVPDWVLKF
jgi:hypothetical protein